MREPKDLAVASFRFSPSRAPNWFVQRQTATLAVLRSVEVVVRGRIQNQIIHRKIMKITRNASMA